ncbi:ATP/GTP-binding protein [Nocardia carnea]|uniref:ATP/GTP-binding protein n=1 Tax=Nocardia carnea TaxID=37328 RepID=UPI0024581B63|nr:ATP/GTP-binding protein [Nocardia carnea]
MPRRKPRSGRYGAQPQRLGAGLGDVYRRTEAGPDGDEYVVRTVPGARAVKRYRCPGCDHEVMPGVAHVVAWPAGGGEADRRHWHRGCWNGRRTRGITRRWS